MITQQAEGDTEAAELLASAFAKVKKLPFNSIGRADQ